MKHWIASLTSRTCRMYPIYCTRLRKSRTTFGIPEREFDRRDGTFDKTSKQNLDFDGRAHINLKLVTGNPEDVALFYQSYPQRTTSRLIIAKEGRQTQGGGETGVRVLSQDRERKLFEEIS